MADRLSARAYRAQVAALMPRGRAWSLSPRSALSGLLAAIAAVFARVDEVAVSFLTEILPNSALAFLPDWERVLGLPDDCSALAQTISGRRAAVVNKLVAQPDLSAESYRRIARAFGVEITVRQHDRVLAEAIPGLDTSNGRWRFVWWITIPTEADVRYFDTLSDVNMPLAEIERIAELECRLRKAAPAHTHLVIGYAPAG